MKESRNDKRTRQSDDAGEGRPVEMALTKQVGRLEREREREREREANQI
jgi:hypothetical protein